LVIIHNECERWVNYLERADDKSLAEVGKKYCDPKSGNQEGWSEEGIDMFNRVCEEIKVLREDKSNSSRF